MSYSFCRISAPTQNLVTIILQQIHVLLLWCVINRFTFCTLSWYTTTTTSAAAAPVEIANRPDDETVLNVNWKTVQLNLRKITFPSNIHYIASHPQSSVHRVETGCHIEPPTTIVPNHQQPTTTNQGVQDNLMKLGYIYNPVRHLYRRSPDSHGRWPLQLNIQSPDNLDALPGFRYILAVRRRPVTPNQVLTEEQRMTRPCAFSSS